MKNAIKVLEKDIILKDILHLPVTIPYYDGDVNTYLYSSIISQQLSTKAAKSIYNRFLNHFSGEHPKPEQLLNTEHEVLRSIGLSNSKAKYLHNVAEYFQENNITHESWAKKEDDEIITALTSIKGVGIWTVQMVLMFCLARKDVFPIGDLGVRQSIIELYNVKGDKKQINERLLKIAATWKPYRSIASLYLWSWRNFKTDNG
jgi:DNA-3-methyladenine glycosylase II